MQQHGRGLVTSHFRKTFADQLASAKGDMRLQVTIIVDPYPTRVPLRPLQLESSQSLGLVQDIPQSGILRRLEAFVASPISCGGSDQQRIRLYCRGKENGVKILKSIDEGPFQMGTIRDTLVEGTEGARQLGPERARVYSDLSPEDKDRYNADIRATNILLQRLPNDIYTLINHYTDAKDIWDNVKMLLEGSELTKEDRESQLYDDFEHFRQNKGETIHDYYVRFAKLINDMRNIKMTMSKMQLNSKFVNNMLPEWGRFVTAVKLNRGLRDSNYDHLYAYLKQHEAHANENKMMLDRFTQHTIDPLALMSNVSHQQYYSQSSTTPPSTYVPPYFADNTQLDSGLSSTDNLIENLTNTLALLTQSYKTYLPQTNNQLRTSSNTRNQAIIQDIEVQLVMRELRTELRMQIQNLEYFKDKMLLMQAQENRVALDEEQLLFIAGGQDNVVDEDVDEQPVKDLALKVDNVFHVDDCDAFDFDVDREQKINEQLRIIIVDREENLKKELHSVKLQLTSTINHNKSMVEEVTSLKKDFKQKENKFLEEFLDMKALKEKVEDKLFKQDQSLQIVHMLCKPKPYYDEQNKVAIGYKDPLCLTRAQQAQPALYNGHEIIKSNHVPAIIHNSKDTLEIAEHTRKKMNEKMKDPECVKKKPHDYSKENYLATFTPQKQLTPEQIFWSNDIIKMKAEALKEQTTASRPIKALAVYPPNTPATLALTKEIKEMKDIFDELEAKVDPNVVNRKHDEIERKNLLIANDNLIVDCLSKEVFYIATNSELNVSRFIEMHDAHTLVQARCLKLEAELSNLCDKVLKYDHTELVKRFSNLEITQLTEKVTTLQEQNELFRAENENFKQHYKELYDSIKITCAKHIEQTTALLTENENLKTQIHENMKCNTMESVKPRVLAPGRYAIDVEPIPPHNRNNREVHLDYLKYLKESVVTLCEIVEKAKVERPLDRSLASACLYTKHSQELLEYAIDTCPKDFNQRDKQHVATPFTKKKQVTFADRCETSDNNTHKHVEQLNLQQTNVLVPPSTGVNSCADASRSEPRSNTKKIGSRRLKVSTRRENHQLDTNVETNSTRQFPFALPHHLRIRPWLVLTNRNPTKIEDPIFQTLHLRLFSNAGRTDRPLVFGLRFGNDHFGAIMGYGDYVIGDSVISRHSYYVRDTDGVDVIQGSRGSNLYTISVEDMMKSSPICLLSKASKNKSWLWYRRLNHLNFDTINDLARKDLVRGLPRLKFEKDHLCSACQLGKSKKHTHSLKTENTNFEVLNTLHMDLYGTISKDETSEVGIKFLKQIQVGLNKTVRYICTDNGTKVVNKDLIEYYERVSIFHQKTVPRTPQQNDVVERQNRTLMEAARAMLIFSKAPMFL
ncbi:retrovirus-related pol polyprotein from transposon TNT 1-94 [Tanacetum coccineum]